LKVSSAYLSALEHGHRGKPSPGLVQQVAAHFNLAWEQVDELKALAELSDPRVTIDTAGLTPEATELANRLAARHRALGERGADRAAAGVTEDEALTFRCSFLLSSRTAAIAAEPGPMWHRRDADGTHGSRVALRLPGMTVFLAGFSARGGGRSGRALLARATS